MSSILRPLFPIGLDLVDQPVLVVGGKEEAIDKTLRLLDAKAVITVVSPEVEPQIRNLWKRNRLVWLKRTVEQSDLQGSRLVVNTLSLTNPANRAIVSWARKARILISTYDQPEKSDLGMPAVVSRGHLRIAITTSNASPSVAGAIRRELERLIDDSDLSLFLDNLGTLREELREHITDNATRRTLLRQAAAGIRFSGSIKTPNKWLQRLTDVRRRSRMLGSNDT